MDSVCGIARKTEAYPRNRSSTDSDDDREDAGQGHENLSLDRHLSSRAAFIESTVWLVKVLKTSTWWNEKQANLFISTHPQRDEETELTIGEVAGSRSKWEVR